MSPTEQKLCQCLALVFPDLPTVEIPNASTENTLNWDSVALVTLVSIVEEEFSVSIEPEDYQQFTSFDKIAALLAAS